MLPTGFIKRWICSPLGLSNVGYAPYWVYQMLDMLPTGFVKRGYAPHWVYPGGSKDCMKTKGFSQNLAPTALNRWGTSCRKNLKTTLLLIKIDNRDVLEEELPSAGNLGLRA